MKEWWHFTFFENSQDIIVYISQHIILTKSTNDCIVSLKAPTRHTIIISVQMSLSEYCFHGKQM